MLRQTLRSTVAAIVIASMAACSTHSADSAAESADASTGAKAEPAARAPTVLDDQLKALDKAKSVEETLKKEQADRDKAIEDAGG